MTWNTLRRLLDMISQGTGWNLKTLASVERNSQKKMVGTWRTSSWSSMSKKLKKSATDIQNSSEVRRPNEGPARTGKHWGKSRLRTTQQGQGSAGKDQWRPGSVWGRRAAARAHSKAPLPREPYRGEPKATLYMEIRWRGGKNGRGRDGDYGDTSVPDGG